MANNKKGAAKAAAQQAAAQQAAPEQKSTTTKNDATVELGTIVKTMQSNSLSQDGKAIVANLVQKRWVEGDKTTAELRESGGFIVDALLGDIIVTSFVEGSNMFAFIIEKDPQKYLALKAGLGSMGISLPDLKALPAPTEDQLKKAGVNLLPAQTAMVTVKPEDVTEEAKTQKKAEQKIAESAKTTDNPAEIKNEEQLKASLTAMLVKPVPEGTDRPDARVQRTIKFYRGYLTIQANKAQNAKEELNKVKNLSMIQMLQSISEIVGPCPFALTGTAYFLRKRTVETGSPISAYCLYRRSAVPGKDGAIDEQFVADIVKILLIWSCNSAIVNAEKTIAECNRIIKKRESENTKEAKAAIKTWNGQIDKQNAIIEEMKAIVEYVTNPTFDIIANLPEAYNSEKTDSEEYKLAHRIVDNIMQTYYADMKGKNLNKDIMLKNVQQRAGMIINMFRDPLSQSPLYTESNLVDMVEEEAPAEEAEKN